MGRYRALIAGAAALAAMPAAAQIEFKQAPVPGSEGDRAGLLGEWTGASELEAVLVAAALVLALLRLTVWRHHFRYRRRGLLWLMLRGRSGTRWWAD